MNSSDSAVEDKIASAHGRRASVSWRLPASREDARYGRVRTAMLSAIGAPLRDRNREDSPATDFRPNFLEAGFPHEFVEFALGSTPHHPRLAVAIRQHSRDHLDLGVPRLSRVNEIPVFLDRVRDSFQTVPHGDVGAEQLK